MRYSTFGPRYNTNNSNNNTSSQSQQSYPTGILKKSPPRQERRERTTSGGEDADQAEARNDEVIRRVAEMKQILDAAEEYLEDDGEATDAESVVTQKSGTESELSSNYGKLKHSDSLLLLTQVRILWSLFVGQLQIWSGLKSNLEPPTLSRPCKVIVFVEQTSLKVNPNQDSCIIAIGCILHLLFLRKRKQIFPFLWRHFAKRPSLRQP